MAKQLVNPLERHLEKGVLGLAGLVLLVVVAKFLVSSPNQIELGGDVVVPKTIDARVVAKAELVRQQLRDHQPKIDVPSPIADSFAEAARPIFPEPYSLPIAAALGPHIPLIDPISFVNEKSRLVEVLAVPKPIVTFGRMQSGVGDSKDGAVNWATISSVLERAAQQELQLREYGVKWLEIVAAPSELQRRQQRPDGSWSDDDWQMVDCQPRLQLPPTPTINIVKEGPKSFVKKEEFTAADKIRELLSRNVTQLEALRPMPPKEPGKSTLWIVPQTTNLRDLFFQDDEFLHPTQAPPANPRPERYPWLAPAQKVEVVVDATSDNPQERMKVQLADLEKLLQEARTEGDFNKARKVYNEAQEIATGVGASSAQKDKAKKLVAQADSLDKEIRIGKGAPPGSGSTPPGSTGAPPTSQTVKREPLPRQQIWAHDASPDSLLGGMTYQYRIRPVLFNRLAGVPERMQNPDDAARVFIEGPWSETSDPITIEHDVRYYFTRSEEAKKEVTVEVYQWWRGIWLSTRQKLKVGDRMQFADRVAVPDPDDPQAKTDFTVNFGSDAMVVDIDFSRLARERKVEKGGVKMMPPAKAAAVVLVDSNGNLHERLEHVDKSDPARDAIRSRVWKPTRSSKGGP